MKRIRLHVNVDHIATLRQQRFTKYPEPITAAAIAELAGADGITVHLREDRRHIQDRDVKLLRELVQTHLNLEMAMTEEMQKIALKYKPDTVTLVPEKRQELTTEGGLDALNLKEELKEFVKPLMEEGIRVSLFIDPDLDQIESAKSIGVRAIELSTAQYVEAENQKAQMEELRRLREGASLAERLGLEVAAGHGLDYFNVREIARIPQVEELNIGHSIVCRAVLVGLERAVREMLQILREERER